MTGEPSWRDHILRELQPRLARLTLAADPDGLLLEEGVLAGIHARGFDLIAFEDPAAFRYAYESKYRERWDRGEATDLVVVLRAPRHNLDSLPFDLLQAGRKLEFSLVDLFPNLSAPVVDAIDRSHLEALWQAQAQHLRERLGENATKDFILRHLFGIAPETITEAAGLLRALLRLHYRDLRLPALLAERILFLLRQRSEFSEWPLEAIVPDRKAFFDFLQERWPIFLERYAPEPDDTARHSPSGYGLRFPGPAELPLDDHDVRAYMDNLFLEGHLRPVAHARGDLLAKSWVRVGLQLAPDADRLRRFQGLLNLVEKTIPGPEARHADWLRFAQIWAELWAVRYSTDEEIAPGSNSRLEGLRVRVDEAFAAWMGHRYGGLHNQPPSPPVMVHNVGRHLARRLADDRQARLALLVMDGLSLDQWVTMREELATQHPRMEVESAAVFAWVPTLTPVSRQAIFAGRPPLFFADSLDMTDREPERWRQLWLEQGLQSSQVGYMKGAAVESLTAVEDLLSDSRLRVVGLVLDIVDRIMHGMQLGAVGMHNQVRQWIREGHLMSLLRLLAGRGYALFITSDHGNVEATGIGRPNEGAIAEERGERARIYSTDLLRRQVSAQFPEAIAWPTPGLPDGFFPLLASGRTAFAAPESRLVAHGGALLEEVVVPFAELRIAND
jgi:hypothetical protein